MKEKIDICFIVLHYQDTLLTQKCVNSILLLRKSEYSKILVIDNASPNNSYNELKKIYCNNDTVYIIKSEKNGGFAEGNNFAYSFFKKNFDANYVIALNNDIIFNQCDFIERLHVHDKDEFYIAGPDIYVPYKDVHQNPISDYCRTDKEILIKIEEGKYYCRKLERKISIEGIKLLIKERNKDNAYFKKIITLFHNITKKKVCSVQKKDIVLFGACIIFSALYCKENEFLFEPLTFMYGEEDFLALRCRRKKWTSIFYPDLQVVHLSQGSAALKRLSYRAMCNKVIDNSQKCINSYYRYIEKYREES